MNRVIDLITAASLVALFTGCSHAPLSKTFNEANANNIAVQTVNPDAGNEEAALAALDGQKSEHLLQRYRADVGKVTTEKLVTKVGN